MPILAAAGAFVAYLAMLFIVNIFTSVAGLFPPLIPPTPFSSPPGRKEGAFIWWFDNDL